MIVSRREIVVGAMALTAAAQPPRRIVSLNACLDAMLVHLADRNQIAALSHYARDPHGSTVAEQAKSLPYTWESAEEVIALRPDLVLASQHSALATRNALKRLEVPVQRFAVPKTIAESLAQVRKVARLIGRPERGEALVARVEAALATATPASGARRLTALIYQPNGFAAGPNTLVDEVMTRAGFDNVARRYGLKAWGNVGLERLLADPPEVLLVGEPAPGARGWADRVMTHPALKSIAGRMRQARLPERLLYCGGPVLIETADAMARARALALKEGA
ncbi:MULTISPECIES: ABC transporter substrate-binding protein [Caulobacter]|jgi:iron complex transport system substrate-binding protein|uniref:ABC-type Fe3+-hydroxamate transport system, periplasmic component n=1 Tax=Caulobacter vibrioides OR37 TaxID=1292034 RepID=R0D642_CAUVI|nr:MULTISPECIES: ABC transporter substrate-binding protein [Caulobacter]ENZ83825.1 ABC-type Fe3+-hydroxamate transport system, periplasmic component [Caulobacter vibrioides OR37]MBQ1563293.1 ABC transporter substrate-binding protein [Caulobacter sp.]